MQTATIGQLLVDNALPEAMRGQPRVLDKKGLKALLLEVAQNHPEQYRDVEHALSRIGRHAAYTTGGNSFGIRHLQRSAAANLLRDQLQKEIAGVLSDSQLSDEARDQKIVALLSEASGRQQKAVYEEALANGNPLASQVRSGSRGSPMNLASLLGSDLLYTDSRDRPLPVPVLRNYSQGLSPLEYFAGAYGARRGVVDVKLAVRDSGYLCLSAGTEVRMADFSVRRIEEIQTGDMVLGADSTGATFPVRVTATHSNGIRDCVETVFCRGQGSREHIRLVTTAEHKVLGWPSPAPSSGQRLNQPPVVQPIREISSLLTAGSKLDVWQKTAETSTGPQPTYDLTVDHPDHLFVLANGAIVSNSKQLAQIAHRQVVTANDDSGDEDPEIPQGLPTDTDDEDNEGALLARSVGGYRRNTVLTPKILADLRRKNIRQILVRSPVVGGPEDGGLYAQDVGVREQGRLPWSGEIPGLTAAQALGEPLSQGALCLAKGTLVRMADGSVKPIELIRSGELVLGADKQRNTFPVSVVQRFNNGIRTCHRTVFSPAYSTEQVELISTLDHQLLAGRQVWGQKEEALNHVPRLLPVGTKSRNFYAYRPAGQADPPACRPEIYAKFLGLVSGDGCYTESVHGVHLSCYDPSLVEDAATYLSWLNLKLTRLRGHKGYYRFSQIKETPALRDPATGRVLSGSRNPARICLEQRGMYCKYAHQKELPPDIDEWNNASILDYFAGLFSTDGSWYTPANRRGAGAMYFSLGLTALPLVTGTRRLLAERFGIYAGEIYRADKDSKQPGGLRKHPQYKFVLSQAGQVRELTKLVNDRLVGVKRRESVPALEFVANCHAEYRLLRRSQELVGDLPTFDLEVDHPDHLFVLANGLIVSNSSKHSGGVAGAHAAKAVSGFQNIDAQIQIPKTLKGGAAHAKKDGLVGQIEKAPAGGHYVTIDGEKHYVGEGFQIKVKPGDTVEAGDVISEGVPDHGEIVAHKGIGEGRRYFIKSLREAYQDASLPVHRRNVELIARGLINHVTLLDETEDNIPGDVVSYETIARTWKPREGVQHLPASRAVGKYLERPYLHYSIGTKLRPSVVKNLAEFGVNDVDVHDDPPPFEPVMVRGAANLQHDPDWITRMFGSGLKRGLISGVQRGATSDATGTSFVPGLARGVDFGLIGKVHTPTPFSGTPKKADDQQTLADTVVRGWKKEKPQLPPVSEPGDLIGWIEQRKALEAYLSPNNPQIDLPERPTPQDLEDFQRKLENAWDKALPNDQAQAIARQRADQEMQKRYPHIDPAELPLPPAAMMGPLPDDVLNYMSELRAHREHALEQTQKSRDVEDLFSGNRLSDHTPDILSYVLPLPPLFGFAAANVGQELGIAKAKSDLAPGEAPVPPEGLNPLPSLTPWSPAELEARQQRFGEEVQDPAKLLDSLNKYIARGETPPPHLVDQFASYQDQRNEALRLPPEEQRLPGHEEGPGVHPHYTQWAQEYQDQGRPVPSSIAEQAQLEDAHRQFNGQVQQRQEAWKTNPGAADTVQKKYEESLAAKGLPSSQQQQAGIEASKQRWAQMLLEEANMAEEFGRPLSPNLAARLPEAQAILGNSPEAGRLDVSPPRSAPAFGVSTPPATAQPAPSRGQQPPAVAQAAPSRGQVPPLLHSPSRPKPGPGNLMGLQIAGGLFPQQTSQVLQGLGPAAIAGYGLLMQPRHVMTLSEGLFGGGKGLAHKPQAPKPSGGLSPKLPKLPGT